MGVSTRKVTEITEQLCRTEISASQVSRISKYDELEQFRNRPLGSYPVVYLDAHYEKVRSPGQHSGCGRLESDRSQLLGQAGGDWGQLPTQRGDTGEGSSFKSWSGRSAADCQMTTQVARRAVFPSVPPMYPLTTYSTCYIRPLLKPLIRLGFSCSDLCSGLTSLSLDRLHVTVRVNNFETLW